MAKDYLTQGHDPLLRRLAQEIVVTQAQEIDVMQRRLALLDNAKSELPEHAESSASSAAAISGDRVYTGDQTSNTVSVIDPSSNKLLGGAAQRASNQTDNKTK